MLTVILSVLAFIAVVCGVSCLIKPPPKYSRRYGAAYAVVGLLLAWAAFSVAPHSQSKAATLSPVVSTPIAKLTDAERSEISAAEESVGYFDDHAKPGTPVVNTCSQMDLTPERLACARSALQFAQAWSKAWGGVRLAQRTVAACFSSGCGGAVWPDRVQGCAWSLVVVGPGTADASADADVAKENCDDLDPTKEAAAQARAVNIEKELAAATA